jgi:hypothetical protein
LIGRNLPLSDTDGFIDSHDATLTMQRKVSPYRHLESFAQFFSDWILFLQIRVFPSYVVRFDDRRVNEEATLRAFGEASESIWPNLTTLALIELVQQRYKLGGFSVALRTLVHCWLNTRWR